MEGMQRSKGTGHKTKAKLSQEYDAHIWGLIKRG